MIAHRIQRKSGKDKYGRLACYILDVKSPSDPAVFQRMADYIVDSQGGGERVLAQRITNCHSDDFAIAVAEIQATQESNRRARGDKSYHLVISFPEGERPSLAQLRDIEDALVASIGLSDHQRISAIHDDTDNLHIHVAINKVHPETLRCVEPYYDKAKLMAACIELEKAHGLTPTNHGLEAGRGLGDGPEKMAAHGGRESLLQWIRTNAAAELVEAAGAAKTWADLHQALATHGLEIRPHGAGLVIGLPGERTAVKASSVARELAQAALTGRLGPYQRPGPELATAQPRQQYAGGPRQKDGPAQALFERYQAERQAALAARSRSRGQLEAAHTRYAAELRQHFAERRRAIKAEPHLRAEERRRARGALAAERQQDWAAKRAALRQQRKTVDAAHPLPTWQDFLQREAGRGDEQALAVLRARSRAQSRLNAQLITAKDPASRAIILDKLQPRANRAGDLEYRAMDGGAVVDRADEVRLTRVTEGSALIALALASAKFADQALVLHGSADFQQAVARAAGGGGFEGVRFADPALEAIRTAAIEARVPTRPEPARGGALEYVNARNAAQERHSDVLRHRLWSSADAGEFTYAGKRAFSDGTEAVLLQRGQEIYVKPATDGQVAKASKWARGHTVTLDGRGRFLSREPERGSRPGPML
jgi:hypothetical protein